jgi:hypothetical protein
MLVGAGSGIGGGTMENSFLQNAANKSYERLLGETIDAANGNPGIVYHHPSQQPH